MEMNLFTKYYEFENHPSVLPEATLQLGIKFPAGPWDRRFCCESVSTYQNKINEVCFLEGVSCTVKLEKCRLKIL